MRAPIDWSQYVGRVFCEWTVLAIENGARRARFICSCSCGTRKSVDAGSVVSGASKRCWTCSIRLRSRPLTHGATVGGQVTPTWESWRAMNERCRNPRHRCYENYGARGISVCDRWRDSYENFLADMGERPSRSHSIDRYPDMNGNYEPGNCRWATSREQNRNRRSSRRLTIDGKTMCVVEWAEAVGVNSSTLRDRIHNGWPERDAVMTPCGSKRPGKVEVAS